MSEINRNLPQYSMFSQLTDAEFQLVINQLKKESEEVKEEDASDNSGS
jgi:hypothetical protein